MKKLDIKTIFIIILGAALIISFFFGNKLHINDHKDEIQTLHEQNSLLIKTNDSIKLINLKIDEQIKVTKLKIANFDSLINEKDSEITKLKNKRNEIPRYVNSLDALGVANAFTNYLENSPKSNRSN